MFYITPTPTSWLIWLAMFAIPVIVVIAGVSLIYFEKMKTGISTLVIGSVALLVLIARDMD